MNADPKLLNDFAFTQHHNKNQAGIFTKYQHCCSSAWKYQGISKVSFSGVVIYGNNILIFFYR